VRVQSFGSKYRIQGPDRFSHHPSSVKDTAVRGSKLLVDERKTSDQVVKSIKARLHQVLRVVAKELENRKHGKTSVLKFLKLPLLHLLSKVGHSPVKSTKVTVVVNGSNHEEHFCPSQGRNGVDGCNSRGNIGAGNSLELSGTVLIEVDLVDVFGESKRIKESGGSNLPRRINRIVMRE
jgi:hypothetical protein